MSMAPPERVVFQKREDIIDYVSRGLPPSRRNFDRVMAVVRNPLTDEQIQNSTQNDIVISERIVIGIDQIEFTEIMDRVYRNNVRNRNMILGAIGVGALVGIGLMIRSDKEKDSDKN